MELENFRCEKTSDCLELNDGVERFCYLEASFSNNTNFCDCSNWYGWIGESCDQVSITLQYHRVASVIVAFLSLCVFVLITRTLCFNLFLGFGPKGKDPVFYAGVCVFLSSFLLFLFSIFHIPAVFDPSRFEISEFRIVIGSEVGLVEDIIVKRGVFAIYCLVLGSGFQFFAAIFVVLSWQRVIAKAAKFESPESVKKANRIERRSYIFISVYILLLIALFSGKLLQVGAFLIAVSSVIIALLYLGVAYKLVEILKTIQVNGEGGVEITIGLVKRVCLINNVCLSSIAVIAIVYAFTYIDFERKLDLGQFNHIMFIRDLGTLAGVIELAATAWYVNAITDGVVLSEDYPKLCYIFRLWDRKHFQLLDCEHPGTTHSRSTRRHGNEKHVKQPDTSITDHL